MKEHIKSIFLVVLVILNFILGSKVLSTEKLWSANGYNFFVNVSNNPLSEFFRKIKSGLYEVSPVETHLEAPELIIINTGYQTSRHALLSTDKEFETLLDLSRTFLNSALSRTQQFISVPKEDFYTALTAKSIYLRYPVEYDAGLFTHLSGGSRTDFSGIFSQLQNIVISSDGYVYIEDSSTGIIYSCYTSLDTSALNEIIDSHNVGIETGNPVINYAFDLGFDKSFATQKTVLSPMIPIYSEGFEVETISVARQLSITDETYRETTISNILPLFNMNPNSLRRYTEVDGTLVFVENNATLKVSPSGCLEYIAKDDGIMLSNSNFSSSYDSVAACADFVDSINRAAKSDSVMQLSSNITASELLDNSFTITLDYIANGRPVKLGLENNEPAVSVTLTNNRMTSYKHNLRSFSVKDEIVPVENYIFALDNAISQFQSQITDIEIRELNIIYEEKLTENILIPRWNVSVKEIIID